MNVLIAEFRKIRLELGPALKGLMLVVGVAILSRYLHAFLPGANLKETLSEILFAVIIGLCIRNAFGIPARLEPGIKFTLQRILRFGIILLGLRLSLQSVVAIGQSAILLVLVCIAIALAVAYAAGRLFSIPPRLAILIGVGTAICGNTAIVATAPVIDAQDDEVSYAVSIITIFGLLAVTLYPLIGRLLGLGDTSFGLWAGTAVNDTSQVVAVGAAYSKDALDVATVVKLMRNTIMAPIIVILGLIYSRSRKTDDNPETTLRPGTIVPLFVVGFLAMSLFRTLGISAGILPQDLDQPGDLLTAAVLLKTCDQAASFAILMALAGIGLGTDIRRLAKTGFKPFFVGLCVAAVLASASLGLIAFAGLG